MPSGPGSGPIALLAIGLFGFWVLLSQKFDAFHLGVGLGVAAAVALAARRLFVLPPAPIPPLALIAAARRFPRFLLYAGWLSARVLISALAVARIVLSRRMPIDPRVFTFDARLPHPAACLTLAHSITLTPGTVTLDVESDSLTVHALDGDAEDSVCPGGGVMGDHARRLFPSDANENKAA